MIETVSLPVLTPVLGSACIGARPRRSGSADDVDLVANALVVGFETLDLEFLYDGMVFLASGGNLDQATLLGIFGGHGIYEVIARATDYAGAIDTLAFNIEFIPEPGTFMLLSIGLVGMAMRRRAGATAV